MNANERGWRTTRLMAAALEVRDLRKTYKDVVAVDGLDLEVRPGECFGLLGPNGAGKTTTIEICEGLIAADSGAVEMLGMRWETDAGELRQRLGIQLQETQLSEKLTVLGNRAAVPQLLPRGAVGRRSHRAGAAGREAEGARGHAFGRTETAAGHGVRAGGRSRIFCFSTNRPRASIRRRAGSFGI